MQTSSPEPIDRLLTRWTRRFAGLPEIGAQIVGRYAEPQRVYHDVRHLADVLANVDTLVAGTAEGEQPVDLDAVELAAWFHDVVYDVGRPDNEAASAELARAWLAPYPSDSLVEEVVRLVLLTRDHAAGASDRHGAVLCDADLAVLAGTPADYDDYTRRVRDEFAVVPDATFRAGRAEVLRGLLALPRLFRTTHGSAHWEAPARANLTAELTRLTP